MTLSIGWRILDQLSDLSVDGLQLHRTSYAFQSQSDPEQIHVAVWVQPLKAWFCTCIGFRHHDQCWHTDEIRAAEVLAYNQNHFDYPSTITRGEFTREKVA